MNKIFLEIIAWSKEDAILIEKAGADRIELIVNMENGGLTPPIDLVKEVLNNIKIPIRVMIRDKWDSFIYDDETMNKHLIFIDKLKKLNVEGIVFGSLTSNNEINIEQLKEVIKHKGNMKLTFHRAFDELKNNYLEEFKKISKLDVDSLLTSGTKDSALEGSKIIKNLLELNTKINILAGKSISIDNVIEIINNTGIKQIHLGLSVRENNSINGKISIEKIKEIILKLKGLN